MSRLRKPPRKTQAKVAPSRATDQSGVTDLPSIGHSNAQEAVPPTLSNARSNDEIRRSDRTEPSDTPPKSDQLRRLLGARQGRGQGLPDDARQHLEAGIGVPMEDVRVQTDHVAASMATQLGAPIGGTDTGDQVTVPTDLAGASPDVLRQDINTLRDAARVAFPPTGGAPSAGLFYGIYSRMREGQGPLLYYVRGHAENEVMHSIYLYRRSVVKKGPLRLKPGFYTVSFVPGAKGRLVRNGAVLLDGMENPEGLDLTVAFVVDPMRAMPRQRSKWTFYPVTRIVARNMESPLGTGAESVYYAVTDIWRVDEQWRAQLVNPLAFWNTAPRYHWQIHTLPAKDDVGHEPKLIREVDGRDTFGIRHTWKDPGRHEVKVWVTVDAKDVSPTAATDRRTEEVVEYSLKMAMNLELLEKHEREQKVEIWPRSAQEALQKQEQELAAERAKESPNQAKIDYLEEVRGKLRDQLRPAGLSTIGPFSVHAVFTAQKTSQTRPVTLFLAFELTGDSDEPYRWRLIDVTYPAFYRTYTGEGRTAVEALLAAFNHSETSFRRTYPPGHILVRVTTADLQRYGIEALTGFAGRDFTFETDSFEKDAYEWLALGLMVVGAAGLVASFVFPPSAALANVLVIAGVAGAALSLASIADRVTTNSFYWDVETFSDIANIAASIAQLGSLAAGTRATVLAKALGTAENLAPELINSLRMATKVQRAFLVTQLGTDAANALILGFGTYQQLGMVDVEFDEESREDYIRAYGLAVGLQRWWQDRKNRITGILAQAVVGGTLIVVSVRSGVQQVGDLRTRTRALKRLDIPAPPPEAAVGKPGSPGPPIKPATPEADQATPPPSTKEVLRPEAPGPAVRWKGRADLEAAARVDAEAGQELSWYSNATDAQLLARDAHDGVAKELLDERFGGLTRPYRPDRPANVAIQNKLRADLAYVRNAVETQRRMDTQGQAVSAQPTLASARWRRTAAGQQLVPPTEKQRQGYQGTLAVATSDIPALAGEDFAGGSPRAMGVYDPAHPIRPSESVIVPQAHGHAEQDIGQQLHDRLARLTPEERAAASGRAIWIRVDQEVCTVCAAGLGGSNRAGVLRRLSELNPDILFVVTANDTSKVYRPRDGRGLP